ncbi:MAG: PepSY domain-containing protein [Helicobacteraceae bacterium]|jgi:sulfite reductase (NADPH) flavoprotein alpha-component|nr:PepSY domain-containing protein [Helicobacteraceae bacterium]
MNNVFFLRFRHLLDWLYLRFRRLLGWTQGGFAKRGFWFQIHWVVGAALGVVIAIVGVTGAALSFRGEITNLLNRDVVYVEPNGGEPLALDELLTKASAALPNSRIGSISLFSDPTRTARLSVSDANSTNMRARGRTQYVNPYTAEVAPYKSMKGEAFFSTMFSLHRWMGDSTRTWGKQLVAAATVALIVLSLSGLYMYLPFMKHSFRKSLKVDFRQKGRIFLYRLHSAFGVWTLIFVLFMSFSGLWWSYGWYRDGLIWLSGVDPASMQRGAPPPPTQAQGAAGTGAPMADRGSRGAAEGANRANSGEAIYRGMAKAYDLFRETVERDYTSVTIQAPQGGSIYSISYSPLNPAHSRASNQLQVDVEKNEVVKHVKYDDKTLGEKFISSIFPLHSGDFFGVTGLILFCVSSLVMALFAITGYMLYYERFIRNRKKKARWRIARS